MIKKRISFIFLTLILIASFLVWFSAYQRGYENPENAFQTLAASLMDQNYSAFFKGLPEHSIKALTLTQENALEGILKWTRQYPYFKYNVRVEMIGVFKPSFNTALIQARLTDAEGHIETKSIPMRREKMLWKWDGDPKTLLDAQSDSKLAPNPPQSVQTENSSPQPQKKEPVPSLEEIQKEVEQLTANHKALKDAPELVTALPQKKKHSGQFIDGSFDAAAETTDNPVELELVWNLKGSGKLVQENGNTLLELSVLRGSSAPSSIRQPILFKGPPRFLKFDLKQLRVAPQARLNVLFENLAAPPSPKTEGLKPPQTQGMIRSLDLALIDQKTIQLPLYLQSEFRPRKDDPSLIVLAGQTAYIIFELHGPAGTDTIIRLDNFEILYE